MGVLCLHVLRPGWFQYELGRAVSVSSVLGCAVYLLLGCVRGFTFIPSTSLVLVGLVFFRPIPLFVLTIAGILVSSACIYFCSGSLRVSEFFERKYPSRIAKFKPILQKHEVKIIIGWSFFPLLPTDLICYICGSLRVDLRKFLLGIFVGEGLCTATYIFLGNLLALWFRAVWRTF